jgi:SurA N-terminal domain
MTGSRALATALVALTLGCAACGGNDDDAGPQPSDVPDGAVAIVGDAEITQRAIDAEAEMLRRTQRVTNGEDGGGSGLQLERQAIASLTRSEAIEQEAAARGIEVTGLEVRQRWSVAVSDQFANKRAVRRFLNGQTNDYALAQLRIQMLYDRVLEQVADEAGGGKEGDEAADRFQEEFTDRWRERTACRAGSGSAGLCADGDGD